MFLFDKKFEKYNELKKVGLAVLVRKDEETVFKKCYGLRDLSTNERIDENTRFRLASVSKQFTAMCVAILEERGKLSPDDYILTYFNDFPDVYKDVKVKDLIYHTAGLPECYDALCSTNKTRPYSTNKDVYNFYKCCEKLNFQPGDRFDYSNGGYNLLATLIERVSGQVFSEFIDTNIFKPLGMSNSRTYEVPFNEPNAAISYSEWPFFEDIDFNTGNTLLGEGGIYSSISDTEKWISALENNTLISENMTQKVFTPCTLNDGLKMDYGFGWEFDNFYGYELIFHGGAWCGFRTEINYFPKEKLWVVVYANSSSVSVFQSSLDIIKCYLDIPL